MTSLSGRPVGRRPVPGAGAYAAPVALSDTPGVPGAPEIPDPVDAPDDGEARRGWSTAQVVGLVLAIAAVVAVATLLVHDRVTTPSASSVDVGFLQDMTSHHSQAVEIAAVGAENASLPEVRAFAREALIFQQYEVGYMEGLLEEWGYDAGDPDRTAMRWMGMSSAVGAMPGMVPDDRVRAARDLTGTAADAEYLRMMSDHHRGGLHMAEEAARRAADPRVRALAERIVVQQRGELADYARAAAAHGITL